MYQVFHFQITKIMQIVGRVIDSIILVAFAQFRADNAIVGLHTIIIGCIIDPRT